MKKKYLTHILSGLLLTCSVNAYSADFKVEVNSLHYAVSINEKSYVSDLIDEEPNLASQLNKEGLTPTHIAIKNDGLSSLKIILEKKINPNIKNANGETPLIFAVKNKKYKAAKILIENNASKTAKDQNGKTAEFYARKQGKKMLSLFIEKELLEEQSEKQLSSSFNEQITKLDKKYEAKFQKLKTEQSLLITPLIKEVGSLNKEVGRLNKELLTIKEKNSVILNEFELQLVNIKKELVENKEDKLLTEENILDIESKIMNKSEELRKVQINLINIENELKRVSEKTLELSSAQMLKLYNQSQTEEEFSLIGVNNEKEIEQTEELEFVSLGEKKEVIIEEKEDNINLIK